MKLKTHMSKQPGSWVPAVSVPHHIITAISHDAAVAHALLQAVNELGEKSNYWTNYGPTDEQKSWIFERANELLAGWGYPQAIGVAGDGEEVDGR